MDKGLKLLFATYWDSSIWGDSAPSDADFAQAKAEGYMFDSAPVRSHNETLEILSHLVKKVSLEDVANAFVYSLSTRQLQYRSALGSYYYALAIPAHAHDEPGACYYCDWLQLRPSDYNEFNFERFKWGGVRHTSPEYALFDLEQFLRLPKAVPTAADWEIFKAILHTAKELPESKKAGAYREAITKKKLLKSNKAEVEVLLDILGICGILSSAEAPCYCDFFTDALHRSPKEHTNDYVFPVNRWKASDGINEDRFEKVFGFAYHTL